MSYKKLTLKNKIINTIIKSGNKNTNEKILLKSIKLIQKSTKKNHIELIKQAIINSSSTFKINQQLMKKGKRKAKKDFPTFILNDSLRIIISLKFMKSISLKMNESTGFDKKLANEILATSMNKSKSIDYKNDLQKQILLNKRYLIKFNW